MIYPLWLTRCQLQPTHLQYTTDQWWPTPSTFSVCYFYTASWIQVYLHSKTCAMCIFCLCNNHYFTLIAIHTSKILFTCTLCAGSINKSFWSSNKLYYLSELAASHHIYRHVWIWSYNSIHIYVDSIYARFSFLQWLLYDSHQIIYT